MRICAIIPAHNEAMTIAKVVDGVKTEGLDPVVIDDGSMDGSGPIARDHGAVVLTNSVKQGKGRSLQRGFAYALEQDYDGVIILDGDGQHSCADLKQFQEGIARHPESVINGTRMGNSQGMPLIRYLTNRLMSWFISLICRQPIPDTQCGYRYISSEVLRDIRLTAKDFEIESEILIKASKKGYRIYSVPIQTIYQDEKSKIKPFKDTLRFFAYIIRESFGKNG